jgi:predicted metalloprotease with PDZ domain
MRREAIAAAFCALLLASLSTFADERIPPARDTPYSGTLTLNVDATDLDHRLFRVRETIPVKPGPLTLLYPQWLPGNHAPRGPIDQLAGLQIKAGNQPIAWTRDPVNMYAFHVQVPAGATSLELEFQFTSPHATNLGRIVMTAEILGVQWEKMLLYPAGHYVSRIPFVATLKLPADWQYATALETETRDGATVKFKPTTLETLADSPLFAGKHFTRVDLDPGAKVPVHLNVVGDSADEVVIKPDQLNAHRKLVREAITVFGSRHFDHYEFLLAVSDNFSGIGLEHHRSSENGVDRGYFKEWDKQEADRNLLPHEMTHSWNGKFRRPADLWTPNFNVPMQNSLLWVYEGMTQYWGHVLSARSGLWSADFTRGAFASLAATLEERRQGREWRDLEDTTNNPITNSRRGLSWTSWQRPEDYYNEGALIWLDADTKIRELTKDQRSLDDFAKAFFGINDGSYVVSTYTFDDVVRTLNAVAPFDWAGFLRERIKGHGPHAPLDGITRGGWKLVYKDEPSEFSRKVQTADKFTDLGYSIGVVIDKDAKLTEVIWNGPAFKAGLIPGGQLIAVNEREYNADLLKQAIKDARDKKAPLELLVKTQDRFRTVKIDYTGGPRYPHLERVEGQPDRLGAIFKARTK